MNDEIKAFHSYVKQMKEVSLSLEELTKLFKSGEISENAYRLIMKDLGDQLSVSVEEIFKLREVLGLARARAKLEWAREKVGLEEFRTLENQRKDYTLELKEIRSMDWPLNKWEEVVSRIDVALSSLTMGEEILIIEQYLSLIKERFASAKAESEEVERVKGLCEQRLGLISERWGTIKREKIERVMILELEASQKKDDIKEVEVRFTVGEIDQTSFEYKISALRGSLKRIIKEISDIRNYTDDMDRKIFRCSELRVS